MPLKNPNNNIIIITQSFCTSLYEHPVRAAHHTLVCTCPGGASVISNKYIIYNRAYIPINSEGGSYRLGVVQDLYIIELSLLINKTILSLAILHMKLDYVLDSLFISKLLTYGSDKYFHYNHLVVVSNDQACTCLIYFYKRSVS